MPSISKKPTPPPSNTSPSPAKPRGGAPRGNTNALKHGIYSRLFRGPSAPRFQSPARLGLQYEIDLLRDSGLISASVKHSEIPVFYRESGAVMAFESGQSHPVHAPQCSLILPYMPKNFLENN